MQKVNLEKSVVRAGALETVNETVVGDGRRMERRAGIEERRYKLLELPAQRGSLARFWASFDVEDSFLIT
jgi:hypothetical protein